MQFHYNLSDREVIAATQGNVAFRFFLDLALESRLPVPSLLSQFRTRLGEVRHQALFDQVVTQAREHGRVRDRLRLKDATHVMANIAVPTTLQLVAQSRQRLLESARPYAPQRVADKEAEAARLRQVTADLKDIERLAAWVAHLRVIVAWADALQRTLGPVPTPPDPVRTRFEAALALAHRVLADRDAAAPTAASACAPAGVRHPWGGDQAGAAAPGGKNHRASGPLGPMRGGLGGAAVEVVQSLVTFISFQLNDFLSTLWERAGENHSNARASRSR